MHELRSAIEDARIVIGENERRVPVEAIAWPRGRASRASRSTPAATRSAGAAATATTAAWTNETAFAGAQVAPAHRTALTLCIDPIWIIGIHAADKAVAAVDIDPILVDDTTARRQHRAAPGAVVLQSAVNLVIQAAIQRDVVKLAQGHEVQMIPMLAGIIGDVIAAVIAVDHVTTVTRIDPQCVMVGVDPAVAAGPERLAAVGRVDHVDAANPYVLVVGRIDTDQREIHGTRIQTVDA